MYHHYLRHEFNIENTVLVGVLGLLNDIYDIQMLSLCIQAHFLPHMYHIQTYAVC